MARPEPYSGWSDAKRRYAEQFGDTIVDRNFLRVCLLVVSAVALGGFVLAWRAYAVVRDFRPVVIRVDEVGRAEAVRYPDYGYRPQEPEIRYFLTEFVRLMWARNRYTLAQNFQRAQTLMAPERASDERAAWAKNKTIESYAAEARDGSHDIDVNVQRVVMSQLQKPPYQATVDFEQVFYDLGHVERNRLLYTVSVVFDFRSEVPGWLLVTNPLGLEVLSYHASVVPQ